MSLLDTPASIASVEAVAPAEFIRAFCQAPGQLRREPFRAGLPSLADERALWDVLRAHRSKAWLAESDGEILGRVAANLSPTRPGVGYLGFFEVAVERADSLRVAAALLERAEGYLREQGARVAYGPIDVNTWLPYRLRIDDAPPPPLSWEPVNPPAYVAAFESAGWSVAQSYHSEGFGPTAKVVAANLPGYEATLAEGFRYEPIDLRVDPLPKLRRLHRVTMAAFADNFLFEPVGEELFQRVIGAARRRPARGAYFAVAPDGSDCGMVTSFVDAGRYVAKSLGVVPAVRGRHVSTGLMYLTTRQALEEGFEDLVGALIRTGNRSEAHTLRGDRRWEHRYALYSKPLR